MELLERIAPKLTIEVEPSGSRPYPLDVETAAAKLARAFLADELGGLEHAQMARYRGQRNGKGFRELGNDGFALGKPHDDCPPRRIGKRSKHAVKGRPGHLTILLNNAALI